MPIVYDKLFLLIKERGKSEYYLRKNGISASILDKLKRGTGGLDARTIEKLCRLLHCQPGDILEFISDSDNSVPNSKTIAAMTEIDEMIRTGTGQHFRGTAEELFAMLDTEAEDNTSCVRCPECGAAAEKGVTTSVTDLGKCLIIVRNVPCYKCSECNEIIYTADVAQGLEGIVESTKGLMQQISIEFSIIEYSDAINSL